MTRVSERSHRFSSRLKRRAAPIHGYFGGNGSGKSWCAILDCMAALDAGYPVLSTVRLLDYTKPRDCPGGITCDAPESHVRDVTRTELWPTDPDDPDSPRMRVQVPTGEKFTHRAAHPLYIKWTNYQQFLDFEDGEVLGDEVTSWASSRESSSLPAPVLNKLMQLRKCGISLRYTTPSFSRTDKGLREVTRAATVMESRWAKPARPQPGRPPSLWKERRLFIARTFDAMEVDEFDARRLEEVRPYATGRYWGPGSRVFEAYDTYDAVTQLGWSDAAGVCISCGGTRRRHSCNCSDHEKTNAHPDRRRRHATKEAA